MSWLALLFALGAGGVLAPRRAHADALAPPPTNCPAGSVGATSRRGEHCEHVGCDGTCAAGFAQEAQACSAEPVAVCVETISYPAADVEQGPRVVSLPAETWNVAHGPCAADGSCAHGRCVRERACVPVSSPLARGGLCSVSRGDASGAAITLSLVALALLTRGARRRSASRARRASRAHDLLA